MNIEVGVGEGTRFVVGVGVLGFSGHHVPPDAGFSDMMHGAFLSYTQRGIGTQEGVGVGEIWYSWMHCWL